MTRSILVTGSSSGIGLSATRLLRERGWTVFASCRQERDCTRLREEGFESPLLDHEDEATLDGAMDAVLTHTGGGLDAVFLNGAYAVPAMLEDLPVAALRANFEANLIGWHALVRRALPAMRASGGGRLVFCSSVLGFVAAPWRGAYVATKHALEGYVDVLRMETHGTGIHPILVQPGPIRTRFRENSLAQFRRWIDVDASPHRDTYARLIARFGSRAPDRFELPPEAVAETVLRAIEARKPRARYPVTLPTRVAGLMRRALPDSALDWTLRRS